MANRLAIHSQRPVCDQLAGLRAAATRTRRQAQRQPARQHAARRAANVASDVPMPRTISAASRSSRPIDASASASSRGQPGVDQRQRRHPAEGAGRLQHRADARRWRPWRRCPAAPSAAAPASTCSSAPPRTPRQRAADRRRRAPPAATRSQKKLARARCQAPSASLATPRDDAQHGGLGRARPRPAPPTMPTVAASTAYTPKSRARARAISSRRRTPSPEPPISTPGRLAISLCRDPKHGRFSQSPSSASLAHDAQRRLPHRVHPVSTGPAPARSAATLTQSQPQCAHAPRRSPRPSHV